MGRGRQKAKQTKVARDLKYSIAPLDPDRLRQELTHDPFAPRPAAAAVVEDADDDQYADPYADQYGDDEDEDEPPAAVTR